MFFTRNLCRYPQQFLLTTLECPIRPGISFPMAHSIQNSVRYPMSPEYPYVDGTISRSDQQYSPIYLSYVPHHLNEIRILISRPSYSTTFIISYGLQFASFTSTLVHVFRTFPSGLTHPCLMNLCTSLVSKGYCSPVPTLSASGTRYSLTPHECLFRSSRLVVWPARHGGVCYWDNCY